MDGTLLAIISGRDRPGVTAAVFDALRHTRAVVLDMEQLVVRGRLILAVLLGVDTADVGDVRAVVHEVATRVGMEVETLPGAPEEVAASRGRINVTVMGAPLPPGAVADLTVELAERGWNIDRIRRIASYPVTAVVFEGSGEQDVSGLRRSLAEKSRALGVDVAVEHAGLNRRGQRLIVMDVDSTVIQDEVIDLLAQAAGQGEAVAAITESAMHGHIDFAESLRRRMAALEGLPVQALAEVAGAVRLTPGARTLCRTLKRLGYHVCLVSGGFEEVVVPVTAELDVDRIRANRLEVANGHLTGRVLGDILDRAGKRRALEEFAAEFDVPLSRTIAVGDGANDIDMLDAAGLGVAFNAKPAVRDAADTSLTTPYLDSVLFLLGITRDEIEEADAADGLRVRHPR